MKYFLKYILVPGLIELGVTIAWDENINIPEQGIHYRKTGRRIGAILKNIVDFTDLKERGHNPIMAHLCLCSHDIQVGDIVWTERGFKRVPEDTLHLALEEKSFKIIGEVSPEASWLKEGMTFDDNDISVEAWVKRDTWFKMGMLKDFKETVSYQVGEEWKVVVLFRCPLSPNHFH